MKTNNTITLKDGRKLGYAEYGDPGGKPLLYFHGWPDSRLRISKVHLAAKEVGVRLISTDRPGYGLSDYKENRTLLDWPDDVVELADKLRLKKFAIIGVSGGGPYSAATAYKIPNRVTKAGIVVGLGPTYISGILKGMAFTNKLGWANYSRYPILAKLGAFYRLLATNYFDKLLSNFDFSNSSDRKIIRENNEDWIKLSREAFRQGIRGAETDLLLYTSDWGFKVKNIKKPIYLWYGSEDKNVTLSMARYYQSQISGSNLKIYQGEGHLISITHAKDIFKMLR